MSEHACRPGCGACCIAPSISTPMPRMPQGKPAGVRCAHLLGDERCELFGRAERPAVCSSLQPSPEMCGASRAHALRWLRALEVATTPPAGPCHRGIIGASHPLHASQGPR